MGFNKIGAIGFLIGYFIIGFVIFYWANAVDYLNNLTNKLIWVNLGLFSTILIGFIANFFNKRK